MVAGGGAGTGYYKSVINGGAGGTLVGGRGTASSNGSSYTSHTLATGGGQSKGGLGINSRTTNAGKFGYAEKNSGTYGTGGGGGYYGGGSSTSTSSYVSAGAGGSSFISGFAGVNAITSASDRTHTNNTLHYSNKYFVKDVMLSGSNSGNGKAKITYVEELPSRTNSDLNDVRYIKDCINGSTLSTANHWIELQAIESNTGTNVAKNKTVTTTSNVTNATTHATTYLVDGMVDNFTGSLGYVDTATNVGNQCVTVDLGSTYNLDEIAVWHYYDDGRTYYENITYVSNDNLQWTKVIDMQTTETSQGKRVTAWDNPLDNSGPYILYTGDYQVFTVPTTGYYKVETWGAQGGTRNAAAHRHRWPASR